MDDSLACSEQAWTGGSLLRGEPLKKVEGNGSATVLCYSRERDDLGQQSARRTSAPSGAIK